MDASHLFTARDDSDIGDREAMRPPKTVKVGPMTEGDASIVPGMRTDSMPALSAPLTKSTGPGTLTAAAIKELSCATHPPAMATQRKEMSPACSNATATTMPPACGSDKLNVKTCAQPPSSARVMSNERTPTNMAQTAPALSQVAPSADALALPSVTPMAETPVKNTPSSCAMPKSTTLSKPFLTAPAQQEIPNAGSFFSKASQAPNVRGGLNSQPSPVRTDNGQAARSLPPHPATRPKHDCGAAHVPATWKSADATGQSPKVSAKLLHCAVWRGRTDEIDVLMRGGGSPDSRVVGKPLTPFLVDIRHCSMPNVDLLLRHGADATESSFGGVSSVRMACSVGQVDFLRLLLRAGVSADMCGIGGWTRLLEMSFARAVPCAEALLDMYLGRRRADSVRSDRNGHTPLFVASSCGFLPLVGVLLDAGVPAASIGPNGHTALMAAARKGHRLVSRRLLLLMSMQEQLEGLTAAQRSDQPHVFRFIMGLAGPE